MTKGAVLCGLMAALAVYAGYTILGDSLGGRIVSSAITFAVTSVSARRIEPFGRCLLLALAFLALMSLSEVSLWVANYAFDEPYRPGRGGAFTAMVLWIALHRQIRRGITGQSSEQS